MKKITLTVCLASLAAGWIGPGSLAPAVLAGPPADGCALEDGRGCDMASDVLVFDEGDPDWEIVTRIVECGYCTAPDGNGNFQIGGIAQVTFGPYHAGSDCTPGSEVLSFALTGEFREGLGSGSETTYVPSNPLQTFQPILNQDLRTACVDPGNLDYRIRGLTLTGAEGAIASDRTSGLNTVLVLPENVRSTDGVPASAGWKLNLDSHPLGQDLTLQYSEQHDETSEFRLWPEGMAFRLGPNDIGFRTNVVDFTTLAGPDTPTPYEAVQPDTGSLLPEQIVGCEDPDVPGAPCSWQIWNAGFFDSIRWAPMNTRFDREGMDMDLLLSSLGHVKYQPLFPWGTWIELLGPAAIHIENSRIAEGGTFASGTAWLKTQHDGACLDPSLQRTFTLNSGTFQPRVTADGGIVAGIEDLNPSDGTLRPPLEWTVNRAEELGCGTFWVPPPLNPVHGTAGAIVGPQKEWLRSAAAEDYPGLLSDAAADGRGLYAGFNYNRNRVCEGGDNDGTLCGDGTDCPGGGECVADRWSPLCPSQSLTYPPTWTVAFQKPDPAPPGYLPLSFEIESTDPAEEMAFYVRHSGVTGVFDGGAVDVTIGDGDPDEFDLEFDAFGLAFLGSHAEWSDTIIRGGLSLDWPSNTMIPFTDMRMCDCGAAKSASTGEPPTENWLEFWSAKFYPHDIRFSPDPPAGADCGDPVSTACTIGGGSAQTVCIDASTPIPHFSPEADASWSIAPDGIPGEIVPLKDPLYEFETHEGLDPWKFHVERFDLSDWNGETQYQVDNGLAEYGYYDAEGQLSVPYFGLPQAAIQVQRNDTGQRIYGADLHEKGNVGVSHILVERQIAADLVPLSYRVDYFPPDSTAVDDGTNLDGRGLLLGYSWSGGGTPDPNLDLGSIAVPSGILMTPDSIQSDIGPMATVRLWGATTGEGRGQLGEIVPPGNLDPSWGPVYENALAVLGGDPWALPPPDASLVETLHATGLIGGFQGHPDFLRPYRTSDDPTDPGMNASPLVGFLVFSPDREMVDLVYIDANVDTNGKFFAFDRSLLKVDRHIKSNSPDQPIAQLERKNQPANMALPGNMSVPFPDVPGLQWDFEYDWITVPPQFISLTGSLDLTKGGLSGIGFDKAGMTLKYWADGDWYFEAGLKLNFNGYGAYGDILLGNCKDLTPLQALDPTVADFLTGISKFKGGYARLGVQGRIFNYGCLLRVTAGVEVGGWYITDSYGGKLRGWVSGKGACIVSVRGDLTLLGGKVGDKYKMQGSMWVAGGIGFCEEEDWDTPADVLDDDWCAACVLSGSITGVTPPKFKLSMDGPDADCSM